MSDYISERFDEMSKALHLNNKVKGLSTYENFRELVIERIVKQQNLISLDLQDIEAVCKSGDVLDALTFDITEDSPDCITSAIQQLRQAHEGMTLSSWLCNMAIRDQKEVPLWAEYLKDILEKMESNHVEMKFGLYFSDGMPPKGVIIAAFTSQNGEKTSNNCN